MIGSLAFVFILMYFDISTFCICIVVCFLIILTRVSKSNLTLGCSKLKCLNFSAYNDKLVRFIILDY